MPILLTPGVRKLYMYNATFVTPGVQYQGTQVSTSWHLWHHVSNPLTEYGNTSTYVIRISKKCLKYIHDIKNRYVTSSTYFVTFMVIGLNTFVIPGVKYIYKNISYKTNALVFLLIHLI